MANTPRNPSAQSNQEALSDQFVTEITNLRDDDEVLFETTQSSRDAIAHTFHAPELPNFRIPPTLIKEDPEFLAVIDEGMANSKNPKDIQRPANLHIPPLIRQKPQLVEVQLPDNTKPEDRAFAQWVDDAVMESDQKSRWAELKKTHDVLQYMKKKFPEGSRIKSGQSEAVVLGIWAGTKDIFYSVLELKDGIPLKRNVSSGQVYRENHLFSARSPESRAMSAELARSLHEADSIENHVNFIKWRFPEGHQVNLRGSQTGVVYEAKADKVTVFNNQTRLLEEWPSKELMSSNKAFKDVSAFAVMDKEQMQEMAAEQQEQLETVEKHFEGRRAIRIPHPEKPNETIDAFLLKIKSDHGDVFIETMYQDDSRRIKKMTYKATTLMNLNPLSRINSFEENLQMVQDHFRGKRTIKIPHPYDKGRTIDDAFLVHIDSEDKKIQIRAIYRNPLNRQMYSKTFDGLELMKLNPLSSAPESQVGQDELEVVRDYFKGMHKVNLPHPTQPNQTTKGFLLGAEIKEGDVYARVIYRVPGKQEIRRENIKATTLMSLNPNFEQRSQGKAANSGTAYAQNLDQAA